MDFQMQVHDFFQDLTAISFVFREEDLALSGSVLMVLLKDSAYRPGVFFLNLFWKGQMWDVFMYISVCGQTKQMKYSHVGSFCFCAFGGGGGEGGWGGGFFSTG